MKNFIARNLLENEIAEDIFADYEKNPFKMCFSCDQEVRDHAESEYCLKLAKLNLSEKEDDKELYYIDDFIDKISDIIRREKECEMAKDKEVFAKIFDHCLETKNYEGNFCVNDNVGIYVSFVNACREKAGFMVDAVNSYNIEANKRRDWVHQDSIESLCWWAYESIMIANHDV